MFRLRTLRAKLLALCLALAGLAAAGAVGWAVWEVRAQAQMQVERLLAVGSDQLRRRLDELPREISRVLAFAASIVTANSAPTGPRRPERG